MARNRYGNLIRSWIRKGRNRLGGASKRSTFRGFWGYHREMALEKSFHSGQNMSYGYRPDINVKEDFYRFGGVGAQEYKANYALCRRWTELTAENKAVPWEGVFDAMELAKSRHGAILKESMETPQDFAYIPFWQRHGAMNSW